MNTSPDPLDLEHRCARAVALLATHASGRALFAEGLSSSFEAYLETRRGRLELDEDEAGTDNNDAGELAWYLEELGRALPRGRHAKRVAHPKIKATAERAVQLWETGEKVVIFCHYRATGRALRLHVSSALRRRFLALGATKLSTADEASVQAELDRLGERLPGGGAAAIVEEAGRRASVAERVAMLLTGHKRSPVRAAPDRRQAGPRRAESGGAFSVLNPLFVNLPSESFADAVEKSGVSPTALGSGYAAFFIYFLSDRPRRGRPRGHRHARRARAVVNRGKRSRAPSQPGND